MTLDLLKRSEAGAALTTEQHDANFDAIESEVNALASALQPGDAITQLDGTAYRTLYVDIDGNVGELEHGPAGLPYVSGGETAYPTWAQLAAEGIATDAVTTDKILDTAVTAAKLGVGVGNLALKSGDTTGVDSTTSGSVSIDPTSDNCAYYEFNGTLTGDLDVTPSAAAQTASIPLLIVWTGTNGAFTFTINGLPDSPLDFDTSGWVIAAYWDVVAEAWRHAGVYRHNAQVGGGTITSVSEAAAIDAGDGATITAETHGKFAVNGSTLEIRKVRLRHASNQASAVGVTLENDLAMQVEFFVADDQTGACTIALASGDSINGNEDGTVVLAGAGRSGAVYPIGTGVYRFEGETDEDLTLDGDVDANGFEVYGAIAPFQAMTGSLAGAASGRSWKITGNATAIPVADGWWAKVLNISGSGKDITPASGGVVSTATGETGTSVTLDDDFACLLHSDGTNLYVDGAVTVNA